MILIVSSKTHHYIEQEPELRYDGGSSNDRAVLNKALGINWLTCHHCYLCLADWEN